MIRVTLLFYAPARGCDHHGTRRRLRAPSSGRTSPSTPAGTSDEALGGAGSPRRADDCEIIQSLARSPPLCVSALHSPFTPHTIHVAGSKREVGNIHSLHMRTRGYRTRSVDCASPAADRQLRRLRRDHEISALCCKSLARSHAFLAACRQRPGLTRPTTAGANHATPALAARNRAAIRLH